MSDNHVRVTFYGHEAFIDFPCSDDEYHRFLHHTKQLASGNKDIPSHYLLTIDDDHRALIAIREVQTAIFVQPDQIDRTDNVIDGRTLLDIDGITLYLRGRDTPITLEISTRESVARMISGLTGHEYSDDPGECVMLTDDHGRTVFFVLAEVQYAVVSASLT